MKQLWMLALTHTHTGNDSITAPMTPSPPSSLLKEEEEEEEGTWSLLLLSLLQCPLTRPHSAAINTQTQHFKSKRPTLKAQLHSLSLSKTTFGHIPGSFPTSHHWPLSVFPLAIQYSFPIHSAAVPLHSFHLLYLSSDLSLARLQQTVRYS